MKCRLCSGRGGFGQLTCADCGGTGIGDPEDDPRIAAVLSAIKNEWSSRKWDLRTCTHAEGQVICTVTTSGGYAAFTVRATTLTLEHPTTGVPLYRVAVDVEPTDYGRSVMEDVPSPATTGRFRQVAAAFSTAAQLLTVGVQIANEADLAVFED